MGYSRINLNSFEGVVVTAKQMARINQIAIDKFGIDLFQMMGSAGLALASLCKKYTKAGGKILVLAGSGHNGGGGLVAAKYLFDQGYKVSVFLTSKELRPTTRCQFEILEKLTVPVLNSQPPLSDFSLIVDAMLGYNIKGIIKEPVKSITARINTSKIPIVSLDLPSGLHPDSGKPEGVAVKAAATLTLAAPKKGLLKPSAKAYIGNLYLADIGIPKEVFKRI